MHLRYADLSLPQSLPNGKVLVYPTINQDCRTLNHFNRRALNSGCSTSDFIHPSVESFWVIISGTGTMKLGSETFTVQPRSLIIIPPDVPHSLVVDQSPIDWFDLSFHSAVWKTAAKALLDGIGEPHGDHIQGQPMLIEGEKLPPQEGNTCYRYPHARPHSTWITGIRIAMNLGLVQPTMFMKSTKSFGISIKVLGMLNRMTGFLPLRLGT